MLLFMFALAIFMISLFVSIALLIVVLFVMLFTGTTLFVLVDIVMVALGVGIVSAFFLLLLSFDAPDIWY